MKKVLVGGDNPPLTPMSAYPRVRGNFMGGRMTFYPYTHSLGKGVIIITPFKVMV
jgi:hypothetical protein